MWVDVADVDSDGDQDVIGSSSMSGTKWWENEDGSGGTWTEHLIDASFDGLSCARPCDLDKDLDVDIIGAAHIEGVICWWENQDGLGVSWLLDTLLMVAGANDAYPADVDSDGQQEVLYAATSGQVGWIDHSEISPGQHWIHHIVRNDFSGACSTCPGNFDEQVGTGVAASSTDRKMICWWPAMPLVNWSGNAESSILDTQASPDWGTIDWTSLEPPGTSVGIQARASGTPGIGSMGNWSDIFWAPGSLEGILSDGDRYFQYRAVLATVTQEATPTLFDVNVSWNPQGADEGFPSLGPELVHVSPNPCAGAPAIQFGLPEPEAVGLLLFDISGRIVQAPAPAEYQPGWHSVQLGELRPGIYFVRMQAGEFEATERFVVME
jgi:hypothetical protein